MSIRYTDTHGKYLLPLPAYTIYNTQEYRALRWGTTDSLVQLEKSIGTSSTCIDYHNLRTRDIIHLKLKTRAPHHGIPAQNSQLGQGSRARRKRWEGGARVSDVLYVIVCVWEWRRNRKKLTRQQEKEGKDKITKLRIPDNR